ADPAGAAVAEAAAGPVADALATEIAGATEVAAVDAARAELAALAVQLLSRARLTIGQRVAARRPAAAVGGRTIGVWCAAPMDGIVLPRSGARVHVPVEGAVRDGGGAVEVVEIVHGDVAVAPAGVPAPTAAPERAHRDPGAE